MYYVFFLEPNKINVKNASFSSDLNELELNLEPIMGYFSKIEILFNNTSIYNQTNNNEANMKFVFKFDKQGSFYFELKLVAQRLEEDSNRLANANEYLFRYQTPIIRIKSESIQVKLESIKIFQIEWSLEWSSTRMSEQQVGEHITVNVSESAIIEQNVKIQLNSTVVACLLKANLCIISLTNDINPFYSYMFHIRNNVVNISGNSVKTETFTTFYKYLPSFEKVDFRKLSSSVDYQLSYKCEINFKMSGDNLENVMSFGYSIFEQNSPRVVLNESSVSKDCVSQNQFCSIITRDLKPNSNYKLNLLLISQHFNISQPYRDLNCTTDEKLPFYDPVVLDIVDLQKPIRKLTDSSLTASSIHFKQFNFTDSNVAQYWVYVLSSSDTLDFQVLIQNLSNQEYLSGLVKHKDESCMSSYGRFRSSQFHCPVLSQPKKYSSSNYICIGQCSNAGLSIDSFTYDLRPELHYAIFMLYSMPRANFGRLSKRDTIRDGNGTSQYVAKYNEILFTSLVYTRDPVRNEFKNINSDRNWIIGIIISSIIILGLLIAIVGVIFYRNRQEARGARRTNKLHGKSRSSNKSGKYPQISDFELPFIEPPDIRLSEMESVWLLKHANCDLKFEDEYKNLPDFRDQKTCICAEDKSNEGKNRFLDIKPYDESRVVLENNIWMNGENCDYINANFIQGYSHKKKFIATQGPLKSTLGDFWHMVWQYRIHAIIMLTNLIEKGMERCAQYWPEQYNVPHRYGDIEVTMRECVKIGDYIKRVFEVKSLSLNHASTSIVSPNGTIRNSSTKEAHNKILIVTQYFYPEWPDRDTPTTDAMSLLHLVRDVNKNHPSHQYPIIVHCSAGVGRTGTYITLDAMFEKLNKESKFNAYAFIKQIREQRQYLVQTSKQYVFIHEALYEYCLYGFTDVEAGKLVAHYKHIKEKLNGHSKSKLQSEFEKLSIAYSHPSSQAREACNHMNKNRNRDLGIVCYDENRVKLSSLNGSSYINATKILVS